MSKITQQKPLVYSCSGCSNVAQLANDIALWLRDTGLAEMSCIAGVGGNVLPHVQKAKSKRPILAIDGCAMNCVKACLKKHQVEPTWHIQLTQLGLVRSEHKSYTLNEMRQSLEHTYEVLGLNSEWENTQGVKLPMTHLTGD